MTPRRFLRPAYVLAAALLAAAVALVVAPVGEDDAALPDLPQGTRVIVAPNLEQIEGLQQELEARRARGGDPYPSVAELIDANRDARLLVSMDEDRDWWEEPAVARGTALLALLAALAVLTGAAVWQTRRR